ncbi:MAG: molybdopterin-dependent oxidoreductase [Gammaproteobacteria bacterium]|nr:molybdopterin-dependent oxidoreductase [Gammaproteobacteria bacterium]
MSTLNYDGVNEITEFFTRKSLAGDATLSAQIFKLDRRQFLKLTGMVGSGLMLGFALPRARAHADHVDFNPNGYIKIDQEGITLYAPNPEIGQGVKTSLPMIVAEELDADWTEIRVVQSEINQVAYGQQFAGGSTAIPSNYTKLRQASATARAMLVQAAAEQWNVSSSTLSTESSQVLQVSTGRKISYQDLATTAASLPVPSSESIKLKDPKQFRLLGTRVTGVDNEALVRGEPLFGIDVTVPDMKYAIYQKCPAIGGSVKSANIEEIKQMPGVVDVFTLEGNGNIGELLPGIAIIANSTWEALQAKRALNVQWDETQAAKDSWSAARKEAARLAQENASQVANTGDFDAAMIASTATASGFYQYHFVTHAPLEPQNCTAHYKGDSLELWAPTQTPGSAIRTAANMTGLQPSQVTLHQMRCGGGFGRRLYNDFVSEAAAIAYRSENPIKLQWTREDDVRYDLFRAGGFHQMDGCVDENGKVTGWRNRFITFAPGGRPASSVSGGVFPGGMIDNLRVEQAALDWTHRCAAWRAPGSNVFAFVVQCFLDELAHAAQRDSLEVLLEVLGEPRAIGRGWRGQGMHTGRAANVVKLAAERAGWGKELPKNTGMGVAFYYSHAGHIAEVAEVSVGGEEDTVKNRSGENVVRRKLTVHKVTVASDVGPIINLSGAENQVEGSVIDALSTMMDLSITFENGRAEQTNFDKYRIMRASASPAVEAHFIDTGEYPPTGLGEPVFPPLAPAVGNAIFAACGHRVRTLPISEEGFYLA